MNKSFAKLTYQAVITAFVILVPTSLAALDVDSLSWTETKEKWGQVIFCQRIYKMPEVQSRLYDFDIKQCNDASQLMSGVVAKYPEQQQLQLNNQAEQHAVALSHNTGEPYHSVAACREYCRELAEIQEKRNDQ